MRLKTGELFEKNAELEKSKAQLQLALDVANDGLWDWDVRSTQLYMSPRWHTMLGYTPGEVMPDYSALMDMVHPDDRDAVEREMQLLMRTIHRIFEHDFRIRMKNGDWKWVASCAKVVERDSGGCPLRIVGTNLDIDFRKQTELELATAKRRAEAANTVKSAFLAMMSHEIRTPMNGVIGAASLMLGTELSTHQEELVHTIQVSGENLLTIINDILDYSKIKANKSELEAEPFNVRRCIEDAFDLFTRTAAKKNIELLYHIDPEVPTMLTGDTTRLRQILVNLLGNAIKFTETGEVRLKVHNLNAGNHRHQLQFAVSDTGIGIADEHKERLFEAFTQADVSNTRKYGGTGLGLTISRQLTELMGGKIWFESKKGEGSTFFFTVDLPPADSVAAGKPEHLPVEVLRGKHALIVDDNETNRWLLSDQLAQWGIISEVFEHPEKAFEHLQSGYTYDIALIDFQMPDMDGSELAKKIYRLENRSRMPVIILSSSYESIPADPSISARLSKPVRINKLCDQMLQVLAEKSNEPGRMQVAGTQIQPKKKRNLRILVAEDNPINQRIVQLMLSQLGCETVVIVSDGEAAVAAAMDATYDVILMDIQMPHMNGLEATRQIRKFTGQTDKLWIIALTAGVMKDEQFDTEEAGMNKFMAKPLNTEQLGKALDEFVSLGSLVSV